MIAVSTAFKQALVSVEINGKACFASIDSNCKHSENVLCKINECLEKIDQPLAANDFFAVVEGPGSFTGLRISASIIKGFCCGLGVEKIIPISSFELIADEYIEAFKPASEFLCIINALSGKYFVCKFDKSGCKIGDGVILTQEEIDGQMLVKVGLQEENIGEVNVSLRPERLLVIAKQKAEAGKFQDIDAFSPVYLRKSQAEDMVMEKSTKK